jgi:hypothetical protein
MKHSLHTDLKRTRYIHAYIYLQFILFVAHKFALLKSIKHSHSGFVYRKSASTQEMLSTILNHSFYCSHPSCKTPSSYAFILLPRITALARQDSMFLLMDMVEWMFEVWNDTHLL